MCGKFTATARWRSAAIALPTSQSKAASTAFNVFGASGFGFQARIAGNWRDVYLDHFGQQQNNSMFGSEPTFVNGNTQIDFTTSYNITPALNVYFAGVNLTDSIYGTRGRFAEQLLDVVDYGRRFMLGMRFRY
jgi:iron complex outermembrane receptor protein